MNFTTIYDTIIVQLFYICVQSFQKGEIMRTDSKHYAKASGVFRNEAEQVRAFLYTDYEYPRHHHDFYEINIIFSGYGTHHIENTSFSVKAGDVFIIPPETVHAYDNSKNLDVFHLVLKEHFIAENKEEACKVDGFLQFTEIEPFLRCNFPEAMFLHLTQKQLTLLKNDLMIIDDNSEFCTINPLKEHTAWKILYWFSKLLSKQLKEPKTEKSTKYEQPVMQALEYIHQNYSEKITIKDLCDKFFLSRSTFLRNFNEICQCSPTEYLLNYRKNKALKMLEEKKLSKTEIAHLCGFYDLSHMERIIKKD